MLRTQEHLLHWKQGPKEFQRVLQRTGDASYLLHSDPEQPTKAKDRLGNRSERISSRAQFKSQMLCEYVTISPL